MSKGTFENFLSKLGKQADKGVKSYNMSATHRIVLKKGDKVVASIQVPLVQLKKAVGHLNDAMNDVMVAAHIGKEKATAFYEELQISAEPLPKKGEKKK
jgi:hypothetical protein